MGLLALACYATFLPWGPLHGAVSFQPPVDYGMGDNPGGLALADVNRDGAGDLVIAMPDNRVLVLPGLGAGAFGSTWTYPAGPKATSVAVHDLDGDGYLDLAVANEAADTISVLLGDGLGSFSGPVDHPTGKHPSWVGAGDLDGDGQPELVSVDGIGDTVAVLPGQGGGAFGAPVFHAVGKRPTAGALADLDRDGRPDLVVADSLDGTLSVLLGDGLGGFQDAVAYPACNQPQEVLTVDVDGDGWLDLAASCRQDNAVAVLLATGPGLFGAPASYPAGKSPVGLAWGDFDGDCILDVAVSSSASGEISILPGDGEGRFWEPQPFPGGASLESLAAGDFNADLKADLAVVDSGQGTVSVLLNDSPSGCARFSVRRSTDAASVRSAQVHATALSGPFDDESGVLGDGQTYYYVVDHEAQLPVTLSVHAHPAANTVRLGFNDGDPASAPVDPSLCFISTWPQEIPADGLSAATVAVIPYDSDGVPLGSGLYLTVDTDLLLPGVLAGPVRDWGDGSYAVEVVSFNAGSGIVSVAVEGVLLLEAPTLVYQAP